MMETAKCPRVLIVDDDADIRDTLGELFRRNGFDVELACDGVDAIERLDRSRPSAILVDLMMPGIIGEELIDYLQSDEELRTIPVAIVSAVPQRAPKGYSVFRKPVPGSVLIDFVRQRATIT
jgi:two-component system, OmpR family, response regulator MprA